MTRCCILRCQSVTWEYKVLVGYFSNDMTWEWRKFTFEMEALGEEEVKNENENPEVGWRSRFHQSCIAHTYWNVCVIVGASKSFECNNMSVVAMYVLMYVLIGCLVVVLSLIPNDTVCQDTDFPASKEASDKVGLIYHLYSITYKHMKGCCLLQIT